MVEPGNLHQIPISKFLHQGWNDLIAIGIPEPRENWCSVPASEKPPAWRLFLPDDLGAALSALALLYFCYERLSCSDYSTVFLIFTQSDPTPIFLASNPKPSRLLRHWTQNITFEMARGASRSRIPPCRKFLIRLGVTLDHVEFFYENLPVHRIYRQNFCLIFCSRPVVTTTVSPLRICFDSAIPTRTFLPSTTRLPAQGNNFHELFPTKFTSHWAENTCPTGSHLGVNQDTGVGSNLI